MSDTELKIVEKDKKKSKDELATFLGLARVRPKTAQKLVENRSVQPLTLSGNQKQRVSAAVDEYEKAVQEVTNGSKLGNLGVDIGLITATLVLVILSGFFATSVAGLASTAGVGGVSILAEAKGIAEVIKGYNNEKSGLKESVRYLRSKLAMCDENDKEGLDKVSALLDSMWEILRNTKK
jgi:hypothetical protein